MENSKPEQNTLLSLLKDINQATLTKQDVLNAFQKVIDLVKGMRSRNESEIAAMQTNIKLLGDRLQNSIDSRLASLKGKDGLNGRDGIDGVDGDDGEDGEDGQDADEESIVATVLARIPAPDLQDLKNELDARFEELEKKIAERPSFGGIFAGRSIPRVFLIDLSSQLDGSKKSFALPTNFGIIAVNASGAPFGAFRPVVDYTQVGKNIVFDQTNVDAPSALAAGGSLVITILK